MKNIIELALEDLELAALAMADATPAELEKLEARYNALLFGSEN